MSLALAWKEIKYTERNKNTHSPIERNVLRRKINTKKLKPGSVAFYDIPPGKYKEWDKYTREKLKQSSLL